MDRGGPIHGDYTISGRSLARAGGNEWSAPVKPGPRAPAPRVAMLTSAAALGQSPRVLVTARADAVINRFDEVRNGSNASFPAWRRLDRFTPMNGHVRPCSARLSRATNRHLRCASSRGAIAPFKIARSATATRIWPFTPSANTRSARCRRAPGWTSSPQERV